MKIKTKNAFSRTKKTDFLNNNIIIYHRVGNNCLFFKETYFKQTNDNAIITLKSFHINKYQKLSEWNSRERPINSHE